MPASWIPWWTPAGTHKLASYNKGIEGHEQIVIPSSRRKISAQVFASSFRIPGLTSANHNLFRLENASGSTILIAVRQLQIIMDDTAVDLTGIDTIRTFKVTSSLATGGTASTKHLFDSNDSSNASAVFACAASADGTASAITWTAAGGTAGWRAFLDRTDTEVGTHNIRFKDLIPSLCMTDPIILRAGQQLVGAVLEASLVTHHYILNAMWEEFTLP